MTASPSGPHFPLPQSTAGHPNAGGLVDTTAATRPAVAGNKRPAERNTADLLEPHWAAAIDAATD